jgi:hypothetical protein
VARSSGLSTNSGSLNKIARKSSYLGSPLGDLRFYHLNPGSVVRNINELQLFFDNLAKDVVCISESWLKSQHTDKKFNSYGFKLFRADRGGNRRGGGIAIYIRSDYKCKILAQSAHSATDVFPLYRALLV